MLGLSNTLCKHISSTVLLKKVQIYKATVSTLRPKVPKCDLFGRGVRGRLGVQIQELEAFIFRK